MDHTIKLPVISWKILRDSLNVGGWATTPRDIYVAGDMDKEETIKIPLVNDDTEIEFTLTDKQFKTCINCLRWMVNKGALFANKYSSSLLKEFIGEE